MTSSQTTGGLALLGRRSFLTGLGLSAGLLLARGLGVPGLVGRKQRTYAEALRALGASLTAKQRALLVFPADHPSRQVVNTLAVLERPHLGTLLSAQQRALVDDVYLSMLSPRGHAAFAGTLAVEGRLDGSVLAIYGEPLDGTAQVTISGGHLMLRGGGEGDSRAAFGGGLAYGHQIGNYRWRVQGNSFAYHGDAANRVYASLSPAERPAAILPEPPHELVLQVQGRSGAAFPGVRVGSLSEPARETSAQLLDTVLSCYPEGERTRALGCIEGNGGLEALHVAFYASHGFYEDMTPYAGLSADERARRGDPYFQVWRIEGPGTVVHFKGYPHVHAYIQIVRDPARANLGESLGAVSARVEGDAMRDLLEGALRQATGEGLAFHGDEVPGRFCPGEVTTGLAYALDPYQNHVAVATIAGRAMGESLRRRLEARAASIEPEGRYRVATTDYYASQRDSFGEPERIERDEGLLGDALIAHLRKGGLRTGAGRSASAG